MEGLASVDGVIARVMPAWRPPPRLSLSQWADEKYYLSAESSAQPGRWTTLPYQREPMDAITDPAVTFVTFMKSARVGYTKMIGAAIGYSIEHDPCSVLVVQPTVDDAKGYSKEEIAPMLRDCPSLTKIVIDDPIEDVGPRDSGNTILHKKYPGGVLSLVGANSGAGFRRVSRKRVFFDEVDGYPPSAGSDGDPIKLGIKRTEYFWDRKVVAGSTPLIAGASRIEQLFLDGDQRRYHVPCPTCGHFDYLVFSERDSGGHWMQWDEGKPETAHFVCSKSGCVIEHKDKRDMVTRGKWIAAKPFKGHASFHIWTAYSWAPNATWAHIAAEFLAAKKDPEQLKTFVNTALGEPWQEQGEAPDWERLYRQREPYAPSVVPRGAKFLTCGVDVQQDRFVYEIVGWAPGKTSWSVEAGVLPGDTAKPESWNALDALLGRSFSSEDGKDRMIAMLAIDSGYRTQFVYNWARRHPMNRVIAVKGMTTARTLLGTPTPVDVMHNGRRIARGCKVWPIGVDVAKSELYGFLRLPMPTNEGQTFPLGFCHFPESHGEDFFKQLTAEHLVSTRTRTGFTKREWQLLAGRENHYLDARVYARAAAALCQLDRMVARTLEPAAPAPTNAAPIAAHAPAVQAPAPVQRPRSDSRLPFLARRGTRWLR